MYLRDSLLVDIGDHIPENVAVFGLKQESTLAYRKLP